LRFLGQIKHGIYDDCKGLHPDTINRYYGTDGNGINTASGDDLDGVMEIDPDSGGVDIPYHPLNPFEVEGEEADFFRLFGQVVGQAIEPVGYGLHPDELPDGIYPLVEFIPARKRGKEIRVSLEDPIWRRRAVLWVQGLRVLAHFNKCTY
jgi:hypothetical protein